MLVLNDDFFVPSLLGGSLVHKSCCQTSECLKCKLSKKKRKSRDSTVYKASNCYFHFQPNDLHDDEQQQQLQVHQQHSHYHHSDEDEDEENHTKKNEQPTVVVGQLQQIELKFSQVPAYAPSSVIPPIQQQLQPQPQYQHPQQQPQYLQQSSQTLPCTYVPTPSSVNSPPTPVSYNPASSQSPSSSSTSVPSSSLVASGGIHKQHKMNAVKTTVSSVAKQVAASASNSMKQQQQPVYHYHEMQHQTAYNAIPQQQQQQQQYEPQQPQQCSYYNQRQFITYAPADQIEYDMSNGKAYKNKNDNRFVVVQHNIVEKHTAFPHPHANTPLEHDYAANRALHFGLMQESQSTAGAMNSPIPQQQQPQHMYNQQQQQQVHLPTTPTLLPPAIGSHGGSNSGTPVTISTYCAPSITKDDEYSHTHYMSNNGSTASGLNNNLPSLKHILGKYML